MALVIVDAFQSFDDGVSSGKTESPYPAFSLPLGVAFHHRRMSVEQGVEPSDELPNLVGGHLGLGCHADCGYLITPFRNSRQEIEHRRDRSAGVNLAEFRLVYRRG